MSRNIKDKVKINLSGLQAAEREARNRAYRNGQVLTLGDIGGDTISRQLVHMLLTGKVRSTSREKVARLARALGVSPEEIVQTPQQSATKGVLVTTSPNYR